MNNQALEISKAEVLKTLAGFLGVEPEDIHEDDSLTEDLHMKVAELSDLSEVLKEKGIDTVNLDFTQIDTVSDLIEALGLEESL